MSKTALLEQLVRAPVIGMVDLPGEAADRPEEWFEEYEERAGIMEFDGMLARQQAEQWSETIVRAVYRLHHKAQVKAWKAAIRPVPAEDSEKKR